MTFQATRRANSDRYRWAYLVPMTLNEDVPQFPKSVGLATRLTLFCTLMSFVSLCFIGLKYFSGIKFFHEILFVFVFSSENIFPFHFVALNCFKCGGADFTSCGENFCIPSTCEI